VPELKLKEARDLCDNPEQGISQSTHEKERQDLERSDQERT